ncbi:MAG: D-sedoheptulose 7-phosphate isomerase [Candidatus Acidiferrum sp.]
MAELFTEIIREIQESIAVKKELAGGATQLIADAARLIIASMQSGGKLIVFGNGGSAADAQHLSAELVGRYRHNRKALAAIALTTDSSALTSISNDYGFDSVFSRQLEAIGKTGDVALAISTSGNSPNVVRAVTLAKKIGIATVGLTGRSGGKLRGCVDICLSVPSDSTPRIQEAHSLIIHILSGIVEDAIVNDVRAIETSKLSTVPKDKDAA